MTGIADHNLRQLMTNLITELYKYQTESERKRIIERQQQGIALAKQKGKYHGRKPQYAEDDPRLQHTLRFTKRAWVMWTSPVTRVLKGQTSSDIEKNSKFMVDCKINPNAVRTKKMGLEFLVLESISSPKVLGPNLKSHW